MNNLRTMLAVDHDPWAVACYRANHEAERVVCGEVSPDLLPAGGPVDIVMGGPPCQPYSTAGKGLGASDERDGIPAFVACVARWRPRVFVMEQVPAFVGTKHRPERMGFIKAAEDAGYVVTHEVLNAYRFGAPQFRRRAWFVGRRRDLGLPSPVWPTPTHDDPARLAPQPWVTTREALCLGPDERRIGGGSNPRFPGGVLMFKSHADAPVSVDRPAPTLRSGGSGHDGCCVRLIVNTKQSRSARTIDEPSPTVQTDSRHTFEYRYSDAMRRKHPPADPDQPSPTVMAKSAKGGAEGLLSCGLDVARRLTPDECARCQSVPDDWVWPIVRRELKKAGGSGGTLRPMPKTHRYRVVGNGWNCRMAAEIGRMVRDMDHDSRTVADLFCGGGLGAVGFSGRCWERSDEIVPPVYGERRISSV